MVSADTHDQLQEVDIIKTCMIELIHKVESKAMHVCICYPQPYWMTMRNQSNQQCECNVKTISTKHLTWL